MIKMRIQRLGNNVRHGRKEHFPSFLFPAILLLLHVLSWGVDSPLMSLYDRELKVSSGEWFLEERSKRFERGQLSSDVVKQTILSAPLSESDCLCSSNQNDYSWKDMLTVHEMCWFQNSLADAFVPEGPEVKRAAPSKQEKPEPAVSNRLTVLNGARRKG